MKVTSCSWAFSMQFLSWHASSIGEIHHSNLEPLIKFPVVLLFKRTSALGGFILAILSSNLILFWELHEHAHLHCQNSSTAASIIILLLIWRPISVLNDDMTIVQGSRVPHFGMEGPISCLTHALRHMLYISQSDLLQHFWFLSYKHTHTSTY